MRLVVLYVVFAIACAPTPATAPSPSAGQVASPAPAVGSGSPRTATAVPAVGGPSTNPTPSGSSTPIDARTAGLVEDLNGWCKSVPGVVDPPLDVLGRIADGRSARETVGAIGRSACPLRPAAYGDGPTELVVIGAYRATGALLWVDRGFWRIAPVPTDFGYLELTRDRMTGRVRELLFAIWSGGSAGIRGFLAVALDGERATITLHSAPGATQMWVTPLSETDLLITGRKHEPDRPWGIPSNCCIPSGHEWLWRWTSGGYVLIAERQARDSYYALNALLGAIDAGRPAFADDVAHSDVLSAAASFFPSAPLWTYRASANANEQDQAELYRWGALATPSTLPPAAVRYEVSRYGGSPSGPIGPSAVITFERVGDGWVATEFRLGTLP